MFLVFVSFSMNSTLQNEKEKQIEKIYTISIYVKDESLKCLLKQELQSTNDITNMNYK